MPLVRFEGFDHLDATLYTSRVKWLTTGSAQANLSDGIYSDGHYVDQDLSIFNTGFERFFMEHDFGFGHGKDGAIFSLHITPTLRSITDFLVFRYQDTTTTIVKELAFNMTDTGKLQCWRSGFKQWTDSQAGGLWPNSNAGSDQNGTLLFELPDDTFQDGITARWEFKVSKSHVTIRKNEVTVHDADHVTVVDGGHNFTRVGLVYDDLGGVHMRWDNATLQDSFDDDFYGIVRVSTTLITLDPTVADVFVSGMTQHRDPGHSGFDAFSPYGGKLADRAASRNDWFDELLSYVEITGGSVGKGIFQFEDMFPVGEIIAMSLTISLRNLHPTNTATYEGITVLDGVQTLLPAVTIQPSDAGLTPWAYPWKTLQVIVEDVLDEQPFADQRWKFGFQVTAPMDTTIQVTQFVLERLHKPTSGAGCRYRGRIS